MAIRHNNLLDILFSAVAESPEKLAYQFVTEEETFTLTYAQLDQRARALAARLQQYSCQGERGMLLLPSGLDYIVAFFGCLYAGIIPVPAYPPRRNHHGHRLAAICENAQAKFILTHEVFAEQCTFAPHVITLDTLSHDIAPQYQAVDLQLNDLAFLQYTSGSTSSPKGVMITHHNILTNLELIRSYFSGENEKICSWLPPYHDMGLIGGILYPLYVRQLVILMAPTYFLQSPLRWLELISKEKVTTSVAPNFAYDLCVKKATPEAIQHLDLSAWRYALNGAEPIRYETMARFCETFGPKGFSISTIRPVYGLAEGTLIVSAADARPWSDPCFVKKSSLGQGKIEILSEDEKQTASALISCGRNPVNHDIQIVDPSTLSALPECEVGEVWVSGPSIAAGYWDQPELTQATLKARLAGHEEINFLRTGDLGFKYQDELFITGRSKDLLIIHGVNYYPQDIEQSVADAHPALQPHGTAAFVMENDHEEQLIIMQEISRSYLNKLDAEEVFNHIRSAVLVNHGIQTQSIVLVRPHSLPKTSSGKIQRWMCRELFNAPDKSFVSQWNRSEKKVAASHQPVDSIDPLFVWITQWLAKRTGVSMPVRSSDSLAQYGFDSLLAAEFAADLQKHLNRPVDPVVILEQRTLAELIEFINGDQLVKQTHSKTSRQHPLVRSTVHPMNEAAKAIYFNTNVGISRDTTFVDNKNLINYAGYNYLGMSGDPVITAAAIDAIKEYGTSVSASRVASGEKPLHSQLEKSLAALIQTENCLVYSSGHATNVSVISHLFGPNDLIVHDSLCHNSILQGAIFSGAHRISFPHNDCGALQSILDAKRDQYERTLIVSEGIFSMDGDIPDVPELVRLKKHYETFLMLDEAHSIGTLGQSGAGIREYFNLNPNDVDIWMGTLSKAFASCGGYIAGSNELIENLKFNAAAFVYSAGISPANTAAALAAIQLMQKEPARLATLRQRHTLLLNLLQAAHIPTGSSFDTPVIPIITGDEMAALSLSLKLKDRGIYAIPIFYPAVEKGKARVRLFINALHSEEQIYFTFEAIKHHYQLAMFADI